MHKKLLLILTFSLFPAAAQAMQFMAEENVFIGPAEVVAADLYLAGENITFLGSAQQDVFGVASSLAAVSGTVAQDLNLAARQIEISAQVGDDARLMAEQLSLSGRVRGSTLILAKQVYCQTQSVFEQDVAILAADAKISGTVNGSLNVTANEITLNGVVAGDVELHAERIIIGPSARIMGSLKYQAPEELIVQVGAVLRQPAVRIQESVDAIADDEDFDFKGLLLAGKIFYRLTLFLGLVAVGCILLVLAPAASRRYALVLRFRPWASLGWGALAVLGIVILFFILLVSLIGIPLAIVLAAISVLAMLVAGLGVGYMLGWLLLRPAPTATGRTIVAFVLGFTFLSLVSLIPVLGELIEIAVILAGLGAFWLLKGFVEPKEAKSEKVIVTPKTEKTEVDRSVRPAVAVAQGKSASWQPEVPAFKRKSPARKTVVAKKVVKRAPASKAGRPGVAKKAAKRSKPKK